MCGKTLPLVYTCRRRQQQKHHDHAHRGLLQALTLVRRKVRRRCRAHRVAPAGPPSCIASPCCCGALQQWPWGWKGEEGPAPSRGHRFPRAQRFGCGDRLGCWSDRSQPAPWVCPWAYTECMDAAFTVSSAESTHIPTDMALLRHRASCRSASQLPAFHQFGREGGQMFQVPPLCKQVLPERSVSATPSPTKSFTSQIVVHCRLSPPQPQSFDGWMGIKAKDLPCQRSVQNSPYDIATIRLDRGACPRC